MADKKVDWSWLYPLLLSVAALLLAYWVIVGQESAYLFKVQELNLFLYSPLFFHQQMVVPGGMMAYLGSYFTQFFYHPWLGTALLCGWCGLLMWLVYKAFALKPHWAPVLLVPLALVLLTDFTLGYWIYFLKLRGCDAVGRHSNHFICGFFTDCDGCSACCQGNRGRIASSCC